MQGPGISSLISVPYGDDRPPTPNPNPNPNQEKWPELKIVLAEPADAGLLVSGTGQARKG